MDSEKKKKENIPVIIPSYEPDQRLIILCKDLYENDINDVLIVDDGSGNYYCDIFNEIEKMQGFKVLHHAVNMGKGRALKTAFNELLNRKENLIGCVTADSDGQHTPDDIIKCMEKLQEYPECLILGCRCFRGENVPFKSRFGNELTKKICAYLCGIRVSDTQTGLRGIPRSFMKSLLVLPGERFEYETRMLIETKGRCPIVEVPIETVYDSRDNHQTHFDPVRDSVRIYRIFGEMFLKYLFSSLSSSVLDLILFAVLCNVFRGWGGSWYVAVATVGARIVSAVYNYYLNYRLVFRSQETVGKSAFRYFLLAVVQMLASAFLVTGAVMLFPRFSETGSKIIVDVCLFFISYVVQREKVF